MIQALYRTVDILAPKLAPDQACAVVRDQQPQEKHVYVWRAGQPAPEWIRQEDLMIYKGASLCSNK